MFCLFFQFHLLSIHQSYSSFRTGLYTGWCIKIRALVTFMSFSFVYYNGSEGTDHPPQATAYTSICIYSLISDSFSGAYDYTRCVLTLLTDYGVVGTFYFPDNYHRATM